MPLTPSDLKRPSHRKERVGDAVRDAMAEYLARADWIPLGVMAIVDHVETSPDLKYAKALVRVFPTNRQGSVIAQIQHHIYDLQQWVNKHVRMRYVPKIRVVLDERGVESDRIQQLLEKIEPHGDSTDSSTPDSPDAA